MRRKIAKRIKKQLKKLGCTIYDEHLIREPGWKRKQCGFLLKSNLKISEYCPLVMMNLIATEWL